MNKIIVVLAVGLFLATSGHKTYAAESTNRALLQQAGSGTSALSRDEEKNAAWIELFDAIKSNDVEAVVHAPSNRLSLLEKLKSLYPYGRWGNKRWPAVENELGLSPVAYAIFSGADPRIVGKLLDSGFPKDFKRSSDNLSLWGILAEETSAHFSFNGTKKVQALRKEREDAQYPQSYHLMQQSAAEGSFEKSCQSPLFKKAVLSLMLTGKEGVQEEDRRIKTEYQHDQQQEKKYQQSGERAVVSKATRDEKKYLQAVACLLWKHNVPYDLPYLREKNSVLADFIEVNTDQFQFTHGLSQKLIRAIQTLQGADLTPIRDLLEKGAVVKENDSVVNVDRLYPLDYALSKEECSPELIALLLEYGAKFNYCTLSLVSKMPRDKDHVLFRELVRGCCKSDLSTLLEGAITLDNISLVDLMLKYAPHDLVYTPVPSGVMFSLGLPICTAVSNLRVGMVRLLLFYGATTSLTLAEVGNLFAFIARYKTGEFEERKKAILGLLCAHGLTDKVYAEGQTIFHEAVRYGDKDVNLIKFFCECGIKEHLNTPDAQGKTPLWLAVYYGYRDQVKLLLAQGARESVNVPDREGRTPLGMAVSSKDTGMVDLLLSHGAGESVTIADLWGRTPLFKAVVNNDIELATMLLFYGADKNIDEPSFTQTALWEAVKNNNAQMVDLLLSHGAAITQDLLYHFANTTTVDQALKDTLQQQFEKQKAARRNAESACVVS